VTLPEGWTFRQGLATIQKNPDIRPELLGLTDAELLAQLGLEGRSAEGLFFPDTYRFPRGTSDREILLQAHRRLESELQSAWARRRENLPLDSPYQALILASLVEKETGAADERPLIAGVFINRLRKGIRLQTDPSVIYGTRREVRRQPAAARPPRRYALQHLYARRPAADSDRAPGPRGARCRRAACRHARDVFCRDRARRWPALFRRHADLRTTTTSRVTSPTCAIAAAMGYADRVRGVFVTFEGVEGVGKSTQIALAAELCARAASSRWSRREPGGTPLAEQLRTLVLEHGHGDVGATAELLVMFAARASHVADIIRPALAAGALRAVRPLHRRDRGLPGWRSRRGRRRDPPARGDRASGALAGPHHRIRRAG
jgi:hypothetical protein